MTHKRGINSDDLFRITWVSDPSISTYQGHLAYVSKNVNEKQDGYATHIRLLHPETMENISFTAGEQDHSPAWSKDGTKLAFIRKVKDKPQVWVMPLFGGEAVAVTKLQHGVSQFQWSPDGEALLIKSQVDPKDKESTLSAPSSQGKSDEPEPKKKQEAIVVDRIRYKSDGGGLWNGRRSHLFLVDLKTKQTTTLTTGDYDIGDYAWSPDGNQIVFVAKAPEANESQHDLDMKDTNDLYMIDLSGEGLRKLSDSSMSIRAIAFSHDGSALAFHASDRSYHNATQVRLYTMQLEDGTVTCLSQALDRPIGHYAVSDMRSHISTTGPVYSRDGASIYSLVTTDGSVQLASFAVDGSGMDMLTEGPREIYQFAVIDHDTLVLASADPLHPGELYRFTLSSRALIPLTRSNDELWDEVELSTPESFSFTASDGESIQAWIMKPIGFHEGSKVPTVLEIHGGPHAMYAHTFMHEFQLLASRGYAVVFCNPRGGHGYGQLYVNAVRGDYGGRDYQDVMEAMDHALKTYSFIDETRLGVTGGSYGGFMTNWIVGHTNRFKAAVTQRSISNWISFYGVSDIGFHFSEDQIGGNPWQHIELLWKHSPIAYVEQVETPLLILHGEQDLRCPIEQAEQLFTALKRLGKETRFVRFPNSNHELSRGGHPGLRTQRLEHIVGWFDTHL